MRLELRPEFLVAASPHASTPCPCGRGCRLEIELSELTKLLTSMELGTKLPALSQRIYDNLLEAQVADDMLLGQGLLAEHRRILDDVVRQFWSRVVGGGGFRALSEFDSFRGLDGKLCLPFPRYIEQSRRPSRTPPYNRSRRI